jgi:hypothetical protein
MSRNAARSTNERGTPVTDVETMRRNHHTAVPVDALVTTMTGVNVTTSRPVATPARSIEGNERNPFTLRLACADRQRSTARLVAGRWQDPPEMGGVPGPPYRQTTHGTFTGNGREPCRRIRFWRSR